MDFRNSLINWSLLMGLVFLWGTTFLVIAVSVETIDPISTTFFRLVLGALVLLALVFVSGKRLPTSSSAWLAFTLMGLMGNSIPFFLISWGQQTVTSGVAGMIMGIMPLITMLLAHYFIADEKLNRYKIIGFVFGLVGITFLLGPVFEGGAQAVLSGIAIFIAASCYAINTILVKRLPKFSPLVGACGVLIMASVILFPFWWLMAPQTTGASQDSIVAVIWLGIGPTGIATAVLFLAIARAGPSFISTMNYMIPAVAFFCGVWILSEPVFWHHYAALLTILAGIALTRFRANQHLKRAKA